MSEERVLGCVANNCIHQTKHSNALLSIFTVVYRMFIRLIGISHSSDAASVVCRAFCAILDEKGIEEMENDINLILKLVCLSMVCSVYKLQLNGHTRIQQPHSNAVVLR